MRSKYSNKFWRYFARQALESEETERLFEKHGKDYLDVLAYYYKNRRLFYHDELTFKVNSLFIFGYDRNFKSLNELDKKNFIHLTSKTLSVDKTFSIIELLASGANRDLERFIHKKSRRSFVKVRKYLKKDSNSHDLDQHSLEEESVKLIFRKLLESKYGEDSVNNVSLELEFSGILNSEENIFKLLKFRDENLEYGGAPAEWIEAAALLNFDKPWI